MSARWCPCLLLSMLPFVACGQRAPTIHRFAGPTMGSTFELKYVAPARDERVERLVQGELDAFDRTFSAWRPDSELQAVNAHRSTAPLPVSKRFAEVLTLALEVAVASDGAFDPTVKPMSDAFRAAKRAAAAPGAAPFDDAQIARLVPLVDYRQVAVIDGALVKRRDDVQIDLDGIVAGAAADAIADHLVRFGVSAFYLEITGEVLCRGLKPGGEPWRIAVVDPAGDQQGQEAPFSTLSLRDQALCTSGDYRNAVRSERGAVHHVFDPRTGTNPPHRVVSASVLARSAAVADAIGTALLVLGPDGAAAKWPALTALGAEAALLLLPDDDAPRERGALTRVEIAWPDDS
jgi:FAD:protein FMN transferase